jgi:dihydrofolate reductase
MNARRKIILYIASSVDGYIAKPNDDLSFLSLVEQEGEDYGYAAFDQTIDTVIMGRKTYDWVMKHAEHFPYADKEVYVLSRTAQPSFDKLHFYSGKIEKLISQLKAQKGKNIFLVGGAEIINLFLEKKLIDQLHLFTVPVLLGEGTPLFKTPRPEQGLKLLYIKTYETGMLEVRYQCI